MRNSNGSDAGSGSEDSSSGSGIRLRGSRGKRTNSRRNNSADMYDAVVSPRTSGLNEMGTPASTEESEIDVDQLKSTLYKKRRMRISSLSPRVSVAGSYFDWLFIRNSHTYANNNNNTQHHTNIQHSTHTTPIAFTISHITHVVYVCFFHTLYACEYIYILNVLSTLQYYHHSIKLFGVFVILCKYGDEQDRQRELAAKITGPSDGR